jgi:ABC-type polysaccharide/polyol phosphate export permease
MKVWQGDFGYALKNLVMKDFRVRYRNMSLGVFWSLLNPLVIMGVMTFIFTKIFPIRGTSAISILCGLLPFNFFSLAWSSGTSALLDNAALVKRVPVPRELIPIASVLSNCLHLVIQIVLLIVFVVAFGYDVNMYWFWLPLVWGMEIVFVTGLVMATSALNVYVRDMRYVVESLNTILFWLVPIFYPFSLIPQEYSSIYLYNPIAALVLALRNILMEAKAPPETLLIKLCASSLAVFLIGWGVFHRLKTRFYDYL